MADECVSIFFFQAEDGIRDLTVTGVQTCALPIFQYTNALERVPQRLGWCADRLRWRRRSARERADLGLMLTDERRGLRLPSQRPLEFHRRSRPAHPPIGGAVDLRHTHLARHPVRPPPPPD